MPSASRIRTPRTSTSYVASLRTSSFATNPSSYPPKSALNTSLTLPTPPSRSSILTLLPITVLILKLPATPALLTTLARLVTATQITPTPSTRPAPQQPPPTTIHSLLPLQKTFHHSLSNSRLHPQINPHPHPNTSSHRFLIDDGSRGYISVC